MSRNYKIIILLIAIIFSLVGGAVGGILVRSYFINSSFDVPLFGEINLGANYQNGSLIISKPKNVVVEQDTRIEGVITEGRKSIISFYRRKNIINDDEELNLNNYYSVKDKLSEGLALTNDGWIITGLKISSPIQFVAIDYENEIIEIEEIIFDKITGYYFVKITAKNLTPIRFGERGKITDGQLLVTANQENSQIIYVEDGNFYNSVNNVRSSEILYRFIKIDKLLTKGEAMFNLAGEVVGLYNKDNLVEPINNFSSLLPNILAQKEIARPVLGINYLNLYDLIGEEKLEGVLISKDVAGVAVVKKSPAEKSGLQLNDIILEIDGVKINENNTLSELVQNYEVGDEIELTILREEKRESMKVVLE